MSRILPYLKRAPHMLIFWLVVAILGIALLRSFYPNQPFDEVRTGEQPLEVAGTDDGVWVLNYADHSVSLIDPTTKKEVFEKVVGDDVAPAMSANDDGAWLILAAGKTIGRIDAQTHEIADRFDVTDILTDGTVAQDLAAGDGFVWVTSGEGGQLTRLDTATGEFSDPIDTDESVVQPQVVGDSLWVYQSDGLTEYDNTSGEQIRQIATADIRVHDFYGTEDFLFVLANVDNFELTGLLLRIDLSDENPTTAGASRVRISKSTPTHLTATGEQVFVTGTGGVLSEFSAAPDEPITPVATEQVTVSTKDLRTVIVQGETIWIADGTNGVVHQPITGVEGEITDDTTP